MLMPLQPFKKYILGCVILLGWAWLSCTYEPVQPPEMPTFYQTINIPLSDVTLPVADLQDSTNHIYGDSLADSLYFHFEGRLDTATLTPDIFTIPNETELIIAQDFSDFSDADISFRKTISRNLKLSDQISLPGVSLPLPYDVTLDSIPRQNLIDEEQHYEIFDRYGIPYFKRVDYVTIDRGTFRVTIENQLLVDLEDVTIELLNIGGEEISRSYFDRIPHGATRSDGNDGNLAGKKMRDSVQVTLYAILAGTQGDPLTIPANTDPNATISVLFEVDSLESITGVPEPIEYHVRRPIPPSNNTIIRGVLAQMSTGVDTNRINYDIDNDTPIDLNLFMDFYNFYDQSGNLSLDTDLYANSRTTETIDMSGDTLRNPDATSVVDSIIVFNRITILPDPGDTVSTLPLNFSQSAINGVIQVTPMQFAEIVGFFNQSFAIPPLTIEDIPEGFGFIDFGSVLLNLHFYNEIQASTDLNLTIKGVKENTSPEQVSVEETIDKATPALPVAESDVIIEIAPIFNMVPDSILVSGEAAIPASDTTRLQVGKSFWGSYNVTVPFQLKLAAKTFIPNSSNKLDPVDEETRHRIQQGFIRGAIISQVTNDFPLSGSIELLQSTYDYFPLDSSLALLDSGYQWINDSLYAQTDTGQVYIGIDTLTHIRLPEPQAYTEQGAVAQAGYLYQESVLDTTTLNRILDNRTHYVRPRIFLDSTENYVTVKFSDKIRISALLSLTLEAGQFVMPASDSTSQDTLAADTLSKPVSDWIK